MSKDPAKHVNAFLYHYIHFSHQAALKYHQYVLQPLKEVFPCAASVGDLFVSLLINCLNEVFTLAFLRAVQNYVLNSLTLCNW